MKKSLVLFRRGDAPAPKREVLIEESSGTELVLKLPEETYQSYARVSRLSGQPIEHYVLIHARRLMGPCPTLQSNEGPGRFGRRE